MAKLTSKERSNLPKSDFALPGGTKGSGGKPAYPTDTKARAANAKARASQMENEGKLSSSAKAKIDAKADKVLGKGKKK